jgi:hypothetical protein
MSLMKLAPPNRYGVPTKVWHEWTDQGRETFNRVFDFLLRNEKDVVVGGYRPVARLAAALGAEAVSNKRMLLGEFYFGPDGYRAEQLRRDITKAKPKTKPKTKPKAKAKAKSKTGE